MKHHYWIGMVKIVNRRDCCGNRLAGVNVFIDKQLCGQVPNGVKNGQTVEVKCSKSLYGSRVRLVTTRNEYLSISGMDAITGPAGEMPIRTRTRTSRSRSGIMRPSGPSSKITVESPSMSKWYSRTSYKPDWALRKGGNKTSITANGVGMWWKALF
jgi:hypothetical protein